MNILVACLVKRETSESDDKPLKPVLPMKVPNHLQNYGLHQIINIEMECKSSICVLYLLCIKK